MLRYELDRYESLMPAGVVVTGGARQVKGIKQLAERVLNVPVRMASQSLVFRMQWCDLHFRQSVVCVQWSTPGFSTGMMISAIVHG